MKTHFHDGHRKEMNVQHDAVYCADCDEWMEGKCEDATCEFCKDRPEKPSDCPAPPQG